MGERGGGPRYVLTSISARSLSFSIFSSRKLSSISPVLLGHFLAIRKKHLHLSPAADPDPPDGDDWGRPCTIDRGSCGR